jgi:phosphoglycolate phosphatase
MRYKLAIFDFDGTLADSFRFFVETFNDLAAEYGFERIEERDLDTLRGLSARQMMERMRVPTWRLPAIGHRMRSRMGEDAHRIALFEGVPEMLERLSAGGVALSIVTSNSQENVTRILGPQHAALVAYYECGASLFGKRPKLRRVLERSSVTAGEAICIGDELRDVDAAERERIAFGGVAWGYARADALAAREPVRLFATVAEIADWLTAHGAPQSRSR